MNTKVRQKAKKNFEKDFFKLINNAAFRKLMKMWENIEILNLWQQKGEFFTENLLAIKMRKTQIIMNKTVYLGLSVLHLSKTVMYEFWYDYVKSKYGENAKLCYVNTDSFIVHVKTADIYKDIAEEVETRFDTSNFEIDRPLPKGKNQKLIGLMKDELGGKIKKEFVGLRAKPYSYLKDNNNEYKKAKGTKKCVMKRKIKFEDYKNYLEVAQIENKINHLEKNKIGVDSPKDFKKK